MVDVKGIDDILSIGGKIVSLSEEEGYEYLSRNRDPVSDIAKAEKDSNPLLAYNFLIHTNLYNVKTRELLLRYIDGGFYLYRGNKYQALNDEEVKSLITVFLIQKKSDEAKRAVRAEIFEILKAVCHCEVNIKGSPSYINDQNSNHLYIPLKDKILKVEDDKVHLLDCSPRFFNKSCASFQFGPSLRSEKFNFYLERVQKDPHIRMFLQEWLGYCLVYKVDLEKFVIFLGEGSNGKSVFLLIMKLLIGKDNFSSVPLSQFKADRTFPIASTDGKLANIVEEADEYIDPTCTTIVKQYVSGQAMTVEKKHKDPYEMVPTARITIATNILPDFKDNSNGLWRRLVIISWDQTLGPNERNPDLLTEKYWEMELPAIFNWALEGLQRVLKNRRFSIPDQVSKSIKDLKVDANPARGFLEENGVSDKFFEISCLWLYQKYSEYCNDRGFRPLSQTKFNREVQRIFPSAIKTKNPKECLKSGKRTRFWEGIGVHDEH